MHTPTDITLRTGRLALERNLGRTHGPRLAIWAVVQTGALLLLGLASSWLRPPELALALAMSIASTSTRVRHLPWLPLAVLGTTLLTAITVHFGAPGLVAAGLGAGLAHGLAECGRQRTWNVVNTALAGAVLAPLAFSVASWTSSLLPPALASAFGAATFSLVFALTAVFPRIEWHPVARVPPLHRIRATLRERYHPASIRAWELDRNLGRYSPDQQTREGLGEVAAWVYRLSLQMQALDHELDALPLETLQERIATATRAAESTTDPYTRERRQATVRHLESLARHREALELERQRTESLIEYSLATLEETRTSLVFARPMPGHAVPEGLDEVLGRLRSHAAEEVARRNTAREFEKVP